MLKKSYQSTMITINWKEIINYHYHHNGQDIYKNRILKPTIITIINYQLSIIKNIDFPHQKHHKAYESTIITINWKEIINYQLSIIINYHHNLPSSYTRRMSVIYNLPSSCTSKTLNKLNKLNRYQNLNSKYYISI